MKLLLTLSALLLTACAGHTYQLPKELIAINSTEPLACQFEKQNIIAQNKQQAPWYFWRSQQRTESRDALSNQGEIWTRNKQGQLLYTRIFYNENATVEYMTGDLAATGLNPSWQQLTSLINPQVLGKELALINKETINGVSVEYYSGILNGIATEIDWLPSLQLPARLLKKQTEGSVSLTLTTCNKNALTAKPLSKTEYDKLRRFDYTDLGDMEDDPLVRHLEQLIGGHAH